MSRDTSIDLISAVKVLQTMQTWLCYMVNLIIFILNTVFTYIYGRPLAWAWWAGALGWARSRTESRNEACDCIQDSPRVLRFPRIFETAVVKVVAGNTDQTRT